MIGLVSLGFGSCLGFSFAGRVGFFYGWLETIFFPVNTKFILKLYNKIFKLSLYLTNHYSIITPNKIN